MYISRFGGQITYRFGRMTPLAGKSDRQIAVGKFTVGSEHCGGGIRVDPPQMRLDISNVCVHGRSRLGGFRHMAVIAGHRCIVM